MWRWLRFVPLLALAACVPLSLLTSELREQSARARFEYEAQQRSQASAVKCSEAALAGVRAAKNTSNFPGYVTRATAANLRAVVNKQCENKENTDGGMGSGGADIGVATADMGRPDAGR